VRNEKNNEGENKMNHEQLRIISELFMEGRKSYEGMGFMDKPSYKKSVEKAQKVAFQVLRDAVKETETGKNRKEKQEILELLKICVLQLPEETAKEVLQLIDKIEE